jgi:hypothetical protein
MTDFEKLAGITAGAAAGIARREAIRRPLFSTSLWPATRAGVMK